MLNRWNDQHGSEKWLLKDKHRYSPMWNDLVADSLAKMISMAQRNGFSKTDIDIPLCGMNGPSYIQGYSVEYPNFLATNFIHIIYIQISIRKKEKKTVNCFSVQTIQPNFDSFSFPIQGAALSHGLFSLDKTQGGKDTRCSAIAHVRSTSS